MLVHGNVDVAAQGSLVTSGMRVIDECLEIRPCSMLPSLDPTERNMP